MSLSSVSGFSVATKIFLSDTAGLCSLEYQRSLPCGTGLLKMEAAGHAPCGVGGLMASGSWGTSQAANCLVTQSQIFSLSTACGKERGPGHLGNKWSYCRFLQYLPNRFGCI